MVAGNRASAAIVIIKVLHQFFLFGLDWKPSYEVEHAQNKVVAGENV